jgi:AcrR family transcriptional regulator
MGAKVQPTTPRRELVRQELLTKAAEVFEKKGYGQATILDVAQAMQLSRSSLYHYFKSKEEILEALVQEHTEAAAEKLEQRFSRTAPSTVEQLRELLTNSINGRLTGGARLRVLDQLAAEMSGPIKQKFEHGRRRILDLYTRLIQRGIDAGELRPLDARTAALAILGIASWTSWWYSPHGRKSPEELAEALVDIALHGLIQVNDAHGKPQDTRALVRSIQRDLGQLERSIGPVKFGKL